MESFDLIHENTSLFFIRLLAALLLSGMIGFEREIKNHSAGFRTHILVGVGACLMMLLSLYGFEEYIDTYENVRFDPARIPSYVISGIGFLGAGTIIVNGMTIRGLTTAASIWAVAGIGLVVGAGMYDVALLTTLIVLLSLVFLNKIERNKFDFHKKHTYYLVVNQGIQLDHVTEVFLKKNVQISQINMKYNKRGSRNLLVELKKGQQYDHAVVMDELMNISEVIEVDHRY
ncbi:MgtC/SapB family protein [Halobacillus fulvus]|nr:MgtC/SapB family protein [Halobacillus fulvus]